jgi:hypothetical protein
VGASPLSSDWWIGIGNITKKHIEERHPRARVMILHGNAAGCLFASMLSKDMTA